jgi:hypothetical protein
MVAIRADLPVVTKPSRMLTAGEAHVALGATDPSGSCWGHLTSLDVRIIFGGNDSSGHTLFDRSSVNNPQ